MSAPVEPPIRRRALRGRMASLSGNPFLAEGCLDHIEDALILIEDGRIASVGPYAETLGQVPAGVAVEHYENALILPGLIDTHVHYPQLQMIASYGEQLLTWLTKYTFPAELEFADQAHAERVAKLFFREILGAGTTTALVYCTVHPGSVEAFFAESERFNTRMIAGKVLMDRNAPAGLLDTAQRGYDESKALIARWHGGGGSSTR